MTTREPAPVVLVAAPSVTDNPALVEAAKKLAAERTATKDDWNKYLSTVAPISMNEKKRLLGMYAAHLWKVFVFVSFRSINYSMHEKN